MKSFIGFFILWVLFWLSGCNPGTAPLWSQAAPETNIELDPARKIVKVHNSKDVNLSLDRLQAVTKDGGSLTVEGLNIIDNASAVRQANVAQLEAVSNVTRELMVPWVELAKRIPLGNVVPPPAEPAPTPAPAPEPEPTPAPGGAGGVDTAPPPSAEPTTQPADDSSVVIEGRRLRPAGPPVSVEYTTNLDDLHPPVSEDNTL